MDQHNPNQSAPVQEHSIVDERIQQAEAQVQQHEQVQQPEPPHEPE